MNSEEEKNRDKYDPILNGDRYDVILNGDADGLAEIIKEDTTTLFGNLYKKVEEYKGGEIFRGSETYYIHSCADKILDEYKNHPFLKNLIECCHLSIIELVNRTAILFIGTTTILRDEFIYRVCEYIIHTFATRIYYNVCQNGNPELVKYMLKNHLFYIGEKWKGFVNACDAGRCDIIRVLWKDRDYIENFSSRAISYAFDASRMEIAEYILSSKKDCAIIVFEDACKNNTRLYRYLRPRISDRDRIDIITKSIDEIQYSVVEENINELPKYAIVEFINTLLSRRYEMEIRRIIPKIQIELDYNQYILASIKRKFYDIAEYFINIEPSPNIEAITREIISAGDYNFAIMLIDRALVIYDLLFIENCGGRNYSSSIYMLQKGIINVNSKTALRGLRNACANGRINVIEAIITHPEFDGTNIKEKLQMTKFSKRVWALLHRFFGARNLR